MHERIRSGVDKSALKGSWNRTAQTRLVLGVRVSFGWVVGRVAKRRSVALAIHNSILLYLLLITVLLCGWPPRVDVGKGLKFARFVEYLSRGV